MAQVIGKTMKVASSVRPSGLLEQKSQVSSAEKCPSLLSAKNLLS
jgi:hypothetical protein